jgi:TatD DNase family protein
MAQNTPTGFIDIGANLMDPMFQGTYREKQRHESDLHLILDRAWAQNLEKIIITGGTLHECKECLALSKTDPRLFCTVGVHPTRCSQALGDTDISWSAYLDSMRSFIGENIADGKIVAMGELGLDYCRLQFCDKETQKKGFIAQLKVCFVFPFFKRNTIQL